MTELTLDAVRAVIREELAPMRANVDGIPLIQRAVAVLQGDVQTLHTDVQALRDDIAVVSAAALRNVHQAQQRPLWIDVAEDIRSLQARVAEVSDRVRKLEGAE
jgi:hypothetical protein